MINWGGGARFTRPVFLGWKEALNGSDLPAPMVPVYQVMDQIHCALCSWNGRNPMTGINHRPTDAWRRFCPTTASREQSKQRPPVQLFPVGFVQPRLCL